MIRASNAASLHSLDYGIVLQGELLALLPRFHGVIQTPRGMDLSLLRLVCAI